MQSVPLLQTKPFCCGYFAERKAQYLLVDPHHSAPNLLYGGALAQGFRRSGALLYRPHCESCQACIPVRIAVADFRPNRSQRRCFRSNADTFTELQPVQNNAEVFALYQQYIRHRHTGGGMDNYDAEEFAQFLCGHWSNSMFLQIRHRADKRLLAVAMTDITAQGLSAVYSFFATDLPQRSLGSFCILQQILLASQLQLDYLYLGFWIENHPKMHYKCKFQPLQAWRDGRWQAL